MNHITSLKCLICGKEYQPDEVEYVCPDHGYEGILDVQYDYGLISRSFSPATLAANPDYSIWRYKPLLPIEPDVSPCRRWRWAGRRCTKRRGWPRRWA